MLAYTRHQALIECLAACATLIAESEHFSLYRLVPDEIVIVHRFAPDQIDNNIGYFVSYELLPLLTASEDGAILRGIGHDPDGPFAFSLQETFERCVGAIVRSIDQNERRAWHRFYVNSIEALRRSMEHPTAAVGFIEPFGAIYGRIAQLIYGPSLLDVGTCFGFMPLLFAKHPPSGLAQLDEIVGADLEVPLLALANAFAAQQGLSQVRFVRADLLADIAHLGTFDTVTCVHVLEHLDEAQTMPVVEQLWRLTKRRLILSVPIEATPDPRYGHRQVFDCERLSAIGDQLGACHQSFAFHGGWLVADRNA